MQIQQLVKMANREQGRHINYLVHGLGKVFIDEFRINRQQMMHRLFSTTLSCNNLPLGMIGFQGNLVLLHVDHTNKYSENSPITLA